MSTSSMTKCISIIACLTCANTVAALEYKPFTGYGGYQQIEVGNSRYYVAYHGSNETPQKEVTAAWAARSAQICRDAGATHYIQLSHLLEPVTKSEKATFLSMGDIPQLMRVGGFVYIPIFTGGAHAAHVDAPSKLGAIRCVRGGEAVLENDRLMDVAAKIAEAQALGIQVK